MMTDNHDSIDSIETLLAYATGELDAATARAVEARVAGSTQLQRDLDTIRRVLDTLQRDDAVMPRSELIERTIALFHQRQPQESESMLEHAGRIIAQLVFDSRATSTLPGFRGSGEGYHLMFTSEVGDVDLQVTSQTAPQTHPLQVRGQVSSSASPATLVRLMRREEETVMQQTQPDHRGQFRFDSKPGRYDIEVELGRQTLVLVDVGLA